MKNAPVFLIPVFLIILLALAPGEALALRFVVMGDSRGYTVEAPLSTAVLAQVNQRVKALSPAPEFLVFLGDMSYRANIPAGGVDNYTFQLWLDFMREPSTGLTSSLPLYLVLGNHELHAQEKNPEPKTLLTCACQTAYQRFIQANVSATFMPNITSLNDTYKNLAYSFTSADRTSLLVVLDGYYVNSCPGIPYRGAGALDQTQLEYLNDTLSNSTAKAKFVFVHNPAFNPSEHFASPCGDPSMCAFWDIIDANNATAVFSGHIHLFSRVMVDPRFNTVNPGSGFKHSIPQIIAGTCGAPISSLSSKPDPAPDWNVKKFYNYSVVDVDDSGPLVKVVVQSYCGDGSGDWILCDSYTNVP